jgi:hypothetical protein
VKKVIVIILMAVLFTPGLLVGCQEGVVRGSRNLATNEYSFSDFTEVELSSAIRFKITQSGSYGVSITTDDNLFDYIQVSKLGTTLRIQMKRAIYAYITVEAEISMPKLLGLHIIGATRGTASGFNSTENLDIKVSGASSLDLANVSAGDTSFDVSGASRVAGDITAANVEFDLGEASNIQLEGTADDILVKANGASDVNLTSFEVNNANVLLSGASTGALYLDGRLDATLNGASQLKYSGEPTLGDIETLGNSTLSRQ